VIGALVIQVTGLGAFSDIEYLSFFGFVLGLPTHEDRFQERPNKKPRAEQVEHFDFDKITPLRWVKSGVLLVSRAYGITNNTLQSISYSRGLPHHHCF